ncbi:hypothetical protein C4573_02110 [Candidatus Woesearchaeota archaeon]|nr:MAG: hypothetical protein C4573_02110 [Candidatus Woesearchaeota archaeon]
MKWIFVVAIVLVVAVAFDHPNGTLLAGHPTSDGHPNGGLTLEGHPHGDLTLEGHSTGDLLGHPRGDVESAF